MKVLLIILLVLGCLFVFLSLIGFIYKPLSVYSNKPNEKNPFEGKRVVFISDNKDKRNADGVNGHLKVVGITKQTRRKYSATKRLLDIVISFFGLVILSPLFLILSTLIFISDPGPVLFVQKRVGKNKEFFKLHKFRSMKLNTPHNIPTHMLENPDKYITKVGKFIRNHSLDELPQIWDIFIGNMSIIGPRPALWNQEVLISERDKYNANDIKPGLTGWAQINGRDELTIPQKAKLDGYYTNHYSFGIDAKCFLLSLKVFKKDESIVEGKK